MNEPAGWSNGVYDGTSLSADPVTRGVRLQELGLLAQMKLSEARYEEWRATYEGREYREDPELKTRLEGIKGEMGESQFTQATCRVDQSWNELIARFKEVETTCRNYRGAPHRHHLCHEFLEWASLDVAGCIARWPGLSEEDARMIVEGKPFYGMTIAQAAANACVFHEISKEQTEDGSRERYEVILRSCWDGQPATLNFVNGKLVHIEGYFPMY